MPAPSDKIGRRSAASAAGLGTLRVRPGPKTPSIKSVHGKIRAVVTAHPGINADALLDLLQKVDFSENPTHHPKAGIGPIPWLIGYIRGGLRRGYLEQV